MTKVAGIEAEQLHALIVRIEDLEEQKAQISAESKDVYAECKSAGYDVKIVRQIIKERRADPADLTETEMMLNLYRKALAGWETTELGSFEKEEHKFADAAD